MAPVSDAPAQSLSAAYRLSGVARPVDPAYPTNKAVLILAPAVFVAGLVHAYFVGGAELGAAALVGLDAALIVFMTWALTRELAPDDNPAAFVAVGLALAVWPRVGEQSILILAGVLMCARLVNRSTGKAAMPVDSLMITGLLAWITWSLSWTIGLVGVAALVLDASLDAPGHPARTQRHFAYAAALTAVVVARVIVGIEAPKLPAHVVVFGTIAGLCGLAVILAPRPESVGDVDGQPLTHARVRAGLAMGLLAAVAVSVDGGLELQRVAALWACILAVPLGLPIVVLRRRRRRQVG